jgi:hypothetical protein
MMSRRQEPTLLDRAVAVVQRLKYDMGRSNYVAYRTHQALMHGRTRRPQKLSALERRVNALCGKLVAAGQD